MRHFTSLINRNKTNKTNPEEKNIMQNNNAENRKVTLEVNGLTTDSFISLKLANGEEVQLTGDQLTKALYKADVIGGNIANSKLYRRWVMAQWFRQNNSKEGYAPTVAKLSIAYQWKMIGKELETLARLQKVDPTFFQERVHFFSIDTVTEILHEYFEDLEYTVNHLKRHKCKKVPYVKIAGQNIFVADLKKKILDPLYNDIWHFEQLHTSNDYDKAHKAYCRIQKKWLNVYKTYRKTVTTAFKDAYKGNGAYYTLQNMVLYHNCTLTEYTSDGKYVTTRSGMDAYNWMKSQLPEYEGTGYRWTGMLRKCIEDNNFSFGRTA